MNPNVKKDCYSEQNESSSEILFPNYMEIKKENKHVFLIELPGVKNEKDIKIRFVRNSMEVLVLRNGKPKYFGVFKCGFKKDDLLHRLSGNWLVIEITRRRPKIKAYSSNWRQTNGFKL